METATELDGGRRLGRNRAGGSPPESPRQPSLPLPPTPPPFPPPLPPPCPLACGCLSEEERRRLRTQPNVTAFAPPGDEAPDVAGRSLSTGRRCWPAVTKRAHSQSAVGAGAGRPLNSARQLPAVWRVHSAMQYVCQRCGTKEQPFCDWAGPAPRCQGLRELLPALTTKLPFISVPKNKKGGGGRYFGISGFNSLYFQSSQKIPIPKNYQHHKMAAT